MHPSRLRRFARLRPAIRKEWEELLRLEPAASALGDPDVLVHKMDRTIDQLLAGLRQTNESWLRQASRVNQPLRGNCSCALNPLLNYFATGELALRASLDRFPRTDLDEIIGLFHALAQEEIHALCSVCQRRDSLDCMVSSRDGLRPVPISRSSPAALPATRSATGP